MADFEEEYVDLEDAEKKDTYSCKCPACGGEMEYSPKEKMLKCPFCETTKEIDFTQKTQEQDFDKLFETQNTWGDETCVVSCKNCGVKEVVSKKEIGKSCSYCGTPNVVKTDELSGLKPNGVVPFEITKEQASEFVKAWGKKKFYAVRAFKKSMEPDDINGIYDPAFTFDADTRSTYSGRLGKYYYETRTVNGKTEQVRKVRYFSISGNFGLFFDDVLVEASDQTLIKGLSPFDTNNANDYNESFILGFPATQYSKDGKQCWGEAKLAILATVKAKILAQYDYDVVDSFHYDTNFFNMTYKYLLLPIYVGHCTYKSKNYNFFVNGKTGKVAGKYPKSAIKILLTVFGCIAILAAIVVLVMLFGASE